MLSEPHPLVNKHVLYISCDCVYFIYLLCKTFSIIQRIQRIQIMHTARVPTEFYSCNNSEYQLVVPCMLASLWCNCKVDFTSKNFNLNVHTNMYFVECS